MKRGNAILSTLIEERVCAPAVLASIVRDIPPVMNEVSRNGE